MTLTEYLTRIARDYDREAGLQSHAQAILRRVAEELPHLLPAGYIAKGSGGKGRPTLTPWFGLFDPDETSTPQEGLYVVYLFSVDLSQVSISVMQGITVLTERLGRRDARRRLAEDAQALRGGLAAELRGLSTPLNLHSSGFRQQAYEAGCVCSKTYVTSQLPPESTLVADLARFVRIHQLAIALKRELLQANPGAIVSSSYEQVAEGEDPLRDFKPKDEADYVAHLVGRSLLKTRRHERLVRLYGEYLARREFSVSTADHPKDLVARRTGSEYLIEAKIVRLGSATDAVRETLGQLYTYRHFLYSPATTVTLVALFSESIGDAFVRFLAGLGIEAVWGEGGGWKGSDRAVSHRLAQAD